MTRTRLTTARALASTALVGGSMRAPALLRADGTVITGPGAGKTRAIEERAARLRAEGVETIIMRPDRDRGAGSPR